MTDNLESIDSFETQTNLEEKILPNATAVLILGIVSIVGCCCYGVVGIVTGIIALVLHKKDKALYDTNPMVYGASFKNSNAGKICAIIGLVLSSFYIVGLIIYFIFIFVMLADGNNTDFSRSW
tara:strand:+ start:143 stop:511 length:369 start_codon:yes stop_codon:yes gene_type:complete